MKATEKLRAELEANGYSITATMQGNYIAKKGQRTYKSDSIESLYQIILG